MTPGAHAVSGIYPVDSAATDLISTFNYERYVDGVKQGTYDQVPFVWDKTSVADGDYTLIVAEFAHDGSVWPSTVIVLRCDRSRYVTNQFQRGLWATRRCTFVEVTGSLILSEH